jgi:glycerol-3-phosphate dehydrogenase
MRGLRVGLVEQHDFAFGTSSRSSRLLHGGMRYLAQGRLGLVREASVEKKIIHEIAPHLAEPLPFIFPTYAGNRDWRLWQLKIGVKIYDLLCGGRNLGKSSWLNKAATLQKVSGLRADGLNGAVRYFDGFTNDARLVLDTLRSAQKNKALLLNYCRFRNASRQDLWTCVVEDRLTGEEMTVSARSVVNATGPWADGLPHSQVKLRLTKGIHIVVDRARIPVPETVVMTEGKRILFAIPWGERTILGTTDTDYNGSLDDVRSTPNDIQYILAVTNQFFPEAALAPEHIISTWAGLRPLVADSSGRPSDISRSHEIKNPEPHWWDVAGGKLTTYRLMAEQTVDEVARALKAFKRESGPCRTAQEPLLPPGETKDISGILPPPPDRRVVEHYCENEWALHLDDIMVRRAGWHYYRRDAQELAGRVADWMSQPLGWSEEVRVRELERYGRLINHLRVDQNPRRQGGHGQAATHAPVPAPG